MLAYGLGGTIIGLVIHSFPAFRAIASAVLVVVAIAIFGISAYPIVIELGENRRRTGVQRFSPGTTTYPRSIDVAIALKALAPVITLLFLVFVGVIIGVL